MHTNPEVLALLALGERAGSAVELAHIQICPQCADEVAKMARIANIGRSAEDDGLLSSPRPEVWERVCAELGISPDIVPDESLSRPSAEIIPLPVRPSTGAVDVPPATGPRTSSRFRTALVAAALALVAGAGLGAGWQQLTTPANTVIAEASMASLPGWSGASGEARVEVDKSGDRWLVVSMKTPQPVRGNRQVWLLAAGSKGMQPMGFMVGDTGRIELPRAFKLSNFPVVDVSLEPASDGDPRHSGDSIIRGRLNV